MEKISTGIRALAHNPSNRGAQTTIFWPTRANLFQFECEYGLCGHIR